MLTLPFFLPSEESPGGMLFISQIRRTKAKNRDKLNKTSESLERPAALLCRALPSPPSSSSSSSSSSFSSPWRFNGGGLHPRAVHYRHLLDYSSAMLLQLVFRSHIIFLKPVLIKKLHICSMPCLITPFSSISCIPAPS